MYYINDILVRLNSTITNICRRHHCIHCYKIHNICNKISTNLGRKMAFHQDKCNVLSVIRNKNLIKLTYTLHGHPLESLSWYSNQTREHLYCWWYDVKMTYLSPYWDNHGTFTPRLSFTLLVWLNKDKDRFSLEELLTETDNHNNITLYIV